MNPFDLSGPEFLVFYVIVCVFVIAALVLLRWALESATPMKLDLADPYLVAYLRGGQDETLRVAVVSLIDRGLLIANGTTITRADNVSPDSVRKPLDQALLRKFATPGDITSIFSDPSLELQCEQYKAALKRDRLLPDDYIQQARQWGFIAAAFLIVFLGAIKIVVALQRGRTNLAFLVILIIVAIVIAAKVAFPRLTSAGRAMLSDIQILYADLKHRTTFIRPGGASIEAAMLAAAFGVGALEGAGFSYARTLFPRSKESSAISSWSSSCSSSCGSSGSSCGSSCGGGGCGGGCGGCGS